MPDQKAQKVKPDNVLIQLKQVSKTYYFDQEPVHVLKEINFSIINGEYLSILGSSGCGKSTLMHLIGLLDVPTSGEIILNHQPVSTLSDDQFSRLRNHTIGFIFQAFNLINKYTVLENVILPTRYSKTALDFNPEKRARELLARFNLSERAHFFPNQISGGQQQRVAIARALIMHPQLILADEPTGNLDTQTGNTIMDLLEDLNREYHTAIVIVTHEPDIAKRTHRQIHMRDGSLVI